MTTPTPGWGYEEPANDAARPPEDHRVEPVGYDLGDPPAFEQPPLMVPIGQASPS